MSSLSPTAPRRSWPDYSAVWRWHFYAGLLCIPFIVWLSITGFIYLFKPQVEAWLDAPYDHLASGGRRASAEAQVTAALAATPSGRLVAYQVPQTTQSATRILVGRGEDLFRVYVNPQTLAVLKVVSEDDRLMNQISFLHGELAIGDRGSMIVEIAACWAIIMILTGVFLWWPRTMTGLGGILFPRFRSGARLFWRDLHAVTGIWVSALALILLLTGLPWAKNWGGYLKELRVITGTTEGVQDWTTSRAAELRQRVTMSRASDADMHAAHMHGGMDHAGMTHAPTSAALDRLVAIAASLRLAPPVLLTPPRSAGDPWIAKSDSANRPLRATVHLDGETGAVLGRRDFNQRHPIDQVINVGIAAHEGALFGWINQLVSAFAALGLVTLSVSAVVLWLRRRPQSTLGAPEQIIRPQVAPVLLATIGVLAVLFPLFGASLATVFVVERVILRRVPAARTWLGLTLV